MPRSLAWLVVEELLRVSGVQAGHGGSEVSSYPELGYSCRMRINVLKRIFPMHFIRSLAIDTRLYCAVYSDQVGFLGVLWDLLVVAENRQVCCGLC